MNKISKRFVQNIFWDVFIILESMNKQKILKLIKSRRKELGFTQKDMADKLGIEGSQYSRYELDKSEIALDKLLQIGELLNLEIAIHDKTDYMSLENQIREKVLNEAINSMEKLKPKK